MDHAHAGLGKKRLQLCLTWKSCGKLGDHDFAEYKLTGREVPLQEGLLTIRQRAHPESEYRE